MELTTAFQLVPEQRTAAIIVHHPRGEVLRRARQPECTANASYRSDAPAIASRTPVA